MNNYKLLFLSIFILSLSTSAIAGRNNTHQVICGNVKRMAQVAGPKVVKIDLPKLMPHLQYEKKIKTASKIEEEILSQAYFENTPQKKQFIPDVEAIPTVFFISSLYTSSDISKGDKISEACVVVSYGSTLDQYKISIVMKDLYLFSQNVKAQIKPKLKLTPRMIFSKNELQKMDESALSRWFQGAIIDDESGDLLTLTQFLNQNLNAIKLHQILNRKR